MLSFRSQARCSPWPAILAGVLLCGGGRPAAPQCITLEGKGLHLAEVLSHLEKRTGYEFIPQSLGTEIETARKDVAWKDLPLAQTLDAVSKSFGVEFFSLDATGFRVIPLKPWSGAETPAGPYRIRVAPPSANADTGTAITASMALMFLAPEEHLIERVSHLGEDFRVLDNFGRPLVDPATLPRKSATQARVQLLEYRQRLQLTLPDQRAVRIRSLSGSLVCFRKVEPLRVEIPLDGLDSPKTIRQEGVEIEVLPFTRTGRNLSITSRLISDAGLDLVGRGLSRDIKPHLEDEQGKVYRHFTSRVEREIREGRIVREQSSRFERLEGKPVRLVFDMWVRSDPTERVPFRLGSMQLPDRASEAQRPEQRPFYHKDGGTLLLQVLDQAGKPIEGEVALGVARKAGGTAVRWVEVVTDAAGRVRLEQFAPGVYRVTRLFRMQPGAKALTGGRGAVEVTVVARKEAVLPPLKVPVQAAAE